MPVLTIRLTEEVFPTLVRERLYRHRWQGIGHAQAERVAARQRRAQRRVGENDAWQAAIAECMTAVIVGHDPRLSIDSETVTKITTEAERCQSQRRATS